MEMGLPGVAGQIFPGAGEGAGVCLEEVEPLNLRAAAEDGVGEESPAGAEIRDGAVEVGGQVVGEELRAGVDVVTAENASLDGESRNFTKLAEGAPFIEKCLIPGAVLGGVEGAALVFLQGNDGAGGLGEFLFETACACGIRHGDEEFPAGCEPIACGGEPAERLVPRLAGKDEDEWPLAVWKLLAAGESSIFPCAGEGSGWLPTGHLTPTCQTGMRLCADEKCAAGWVRRQGKHEGLKGGVHGGVLRGGRGKANLGISPGKSLLARWIDKPQTRPQLAPMEMELPSKRDAAGPPVFAISCWVLALMAFSELLVAGLALATRLDDSRVVKTVIKEVPKYVAVRIPAAESPAHPQAAVVSRPPLPPPVASLPLPPPTPVTAPEIADPRSERLVKEARQARVAGNMMLAVVKLEEALNQSPEDPSVHYELGLVHEQMGVNDTASAHYEKVFQMGVSGAGALYELAATKLREGFDEPSPLGKLSLARVRKFEDPDTADGQRIVLTIPVQKAPGEVIDSNKVSVEILFFNRTDKGEILMREEQDTHAEQWMNPPFDWTSGDEILRSTYSIPRQDRQTDHLFGQRTYYGQVVILHYGDQVVDVQAWPRDLAARIPNPQGNPANLLQPMLQDTLPADLDPELGVLPHLPKK